MKAAFILAAAGLVAAQDFGGQPECALKCLQENIPKAGCKVEDTACQCASDFQEKLQPIITPCLTKACEAQDLLKAQSAAAEACKEFAKTAGESKPTATSAATSVTGSASVPAIFSSIPEKSPAVPATPHPSNGTTTKTHGASTPTGTSGSGSGSGSESGSESSSASSASSVPTGNAAAAAAGPAFGLLAALGAVLAL